MSLRCNELNRCAASGADEEEASLERNMWMSDRQQKHCRGFVCTRPRRVCDGAQSCQRMFAFQANVACELNEPNLFSLFTP